MRIPQENDNFSNALQMLNDAGVTTGEPYCFSGADGMDDMALESHFDLLWKLNAPHTELWSDESCTAEWFVREGVGMVRITIAGDAENSTPDYILFTTY